MIIAYNTSDKTHDLLGLEADNLLAFLALLGLLRAIEAAEPEWRPRIWWRGQPAVAVLGLALATGREELVGAADRGIAALGTAYEFDRADITFTAEEFRAYAQRARGDGERARLVAAIASDGALKRGGDVVGATPLCAMFGQGHQHFLSRLATMARLDDSENTQALSRALFEHWKYEDETESFRWDPVEDRRYAHQFGDPSENKNKVGTVTGANRLATIGFATLTSAPTALGLATLGVTGLRREQDICWPLVAVPTSLAGHLALLAHPALGHEEEASQLAVYGVAAIARARRYQVDRYFNFERARVQFLMRQP